MKFYVGLHQVSDAKHFDKCFISVNRLKKRKSDFEVGDWIMDSGAFTTISTHGDYQESPCKYVEQINRWKSCGNMLAAVSQDYMCEPHILEITGKTIKTHQKLTIDRYDKINGQSTQVYIMPVLQGYEVGDYTDHLKMYGDRLSYGAWVGVGSICKRNSNPSAIYRVIAAIKKERPDLKLHGFGVKITALRYPGIKEMFHTTDSMAWSYGARIAGRNGNDWREAKTWAGQIEKLNRSPEQLYLWT